MAEKLSPFVYWGQKIDHITLKVDLQEVTELQRYKYHQDPKVDLTEDDLKFSAEGLGVRGTNLYQFEFKFYHPVEPDNSRYRVLGRSIEFYIKKKGDGEVWPRLTYKEVKFPWLKIDFDKVAYEDETSSSENEEDSEKMNREQLMKQIEEQLKVDENDLNTPEMPSLKTSYLFVYNLFQFVGYTFVVIILLVRLIRNKENALSTAFQATGTHIMICQAVAILEIVHPLLGLVKTSTLAPFLQVMGRNFVLFVVIFHEQRLWDAPAVYCLFLVWSLVELIRYTFYMLSTINRKVYILTWLRYTAWIPLYPLGCLLEGIIIIMANPLYAETRMFSLQLPNVYNMNFHFPWFLQFYLLVLATGLYTMMNYMYSQRKKILGGGGKVSQRDLNKKTS